MLLKGLGRNVVALGVVSFLTDISSEMLYPIVPLFLTQVLRAPMAIVGLIEGVAESTASLLKVVSGWYSDRVGKRRPFVIWGYGVSSISKPLLAIASTWHLVLASRLLDRVGKGIRTSARDAMIAASCDEQHRGKAYGLHRGMDTAGAVLGPIAAIVLMSYLRVSYRSVFLLAFIPAVLGVFVILLFVQEVKEHRTDIAQSEERRGPIPPALKKLLVIIGLFAIGNSSDVFLLLRAKQIGFTVTTVLWVYVFYNTVYAMVAAPAGWLSDRQGRRRLMTLGFVLFGIVYIGFALGPGPVAIWVLFAVYGLYAAATEGVAKAYVADLSTAEHRGTAMGLLQTLTGVTALPASIIAGLLWDRVGPSGPFVYGAACALAAAALFQVLLGRHDGATDSRQARGLR